MRIFISIIFSTILLFSCNNNFQPLATVDEVKIEEYTGKWYEIARLPNSFEEGLKCVTANYSLKENGKIEVVNRGHKIDNPDEVEESKGTAWRPDKDEPAKLKVSFFWPFSGKYWIIDLSEDYQYAMVGTPSREYLWILSRSKEMDDDTYNSLISKAETKGFPVENVIKVKQDCNN